MIYRTHCNTCQTWKDHTSDLFADHWITAHLCTCSYPKTWKEILTESGDTYITYRSRLREKLEPLVPDTDSMAQVLDVLTEIALERMQK